MLVQPRNFTKNPIFDEIFVSTRRPITTPLELFTATSFNDVQHVTQPAIAESTPPVIADPLTIPPPSIQAINSLPEAYHQIFLKSFKDTYPEYYNHIITIKPYVEDVYILKLNINPVCLLAGIQHRKNQVYFVIFLQTRTFYQKCHDSTCFSQRGEINYF